LDLLDESGSNRPAHVLFVLFDGRLCGLLLSQLATKFDAMQDGSHFSEIFVRGFGLVSKQSFLSQKCILLLDYLLDLFSGGWVRHASPSGD